MDTCERAKMLMDAVINNRQIIGERETGMSIYIDNKGRIVAETQLPHKMNVYADGFDINKDGLALFRRNADGEDELVAEFEISVLDNFEIMDLFIGRVFQYRDSSRCLFVLTRDEGGMYVVLEFFDNYTDTDAQVKKMLGSDIDRLWKDNKVVGLQNDMTIETLARYVNKMAVKEI